MKFYDWKDILIKIVVFYMMVCVCDGREEWGSQDAHWRKNDGYVK